MQINLIPLPASEWLSEKYDFKREASAAKISNPI